MNIVRQPNESYVTYLKRIVNGVEAGAIDYNTMGDCLLGQKNNYSSDNLRKAYYVLRIVAENINQDTTISESQLLAEIENQKNELYKETVRCRDQHREIRNDLRKMARYENLEQVIRTELASCRSEQFVKNNDYIPKQNIEAALLISDIHYGIMVDNAVNKYDCEIAKARLNTLLNKTIEYCKKNKVETLNIEILGDLVSGIIHVSNRVSQEEDIISQILTIAFLLSSFISTLATHIPIVNVYCVFGNHARVIPVKQDNLNCENFERLIYGYMSQSIPNCVQIYDAGKTDFITYSIGNKRIVLTHGDKDTVSNAIEHFTNIVGYKPDEVHMGHYHSYQCCDNGNSDIIINGSMVGTDDYALSIRKHTMPCQILRIYDTDIATYKIELG